MINLADRVSELADDNLRLQTIIEEQRVQLGILLEENKQKKNRITELEGALTTVLGSSWAEEEGEDAK